MRVQIAVPLIAVTSLLGGQLVSSVSAEQPVGHASNSQGDLLMPPRVGRVATKAALLYWGMPEAEVERVMGSSAELGTSESYGVKVRVLRYPLEPIPAKVTILDGRVSGVELDIAITDERALPGYSRSVWVGMHRIAVLRMLGTPAEDSSRDKFGLMLEHMIFQRPGEPDLSVFLIDQRVAKKRVGRELPPEIFNLLLPSALNESDRQIDAQDTRPAKDNVRVGIGLRDVESMFGPPRMSVLYSFKGRPSEYRIHENGPGGSFACFTFVDGVLVGFVDGGRVPLDQILGGG
jgi:hypothetical protein